MVRFLKRKKNNSTNHNHKPVVPPESQPHNANRRRTLWFRSTHSERDKIIGRDKKW
ncbi:MAG: hypothetical protein QXK06_01435 [Candidatus Diapherotrites archaeon]